MIWKPVPGYEGLYEVSETGSVRSLPRTNPRGTRLWGKILKPGNQIGGSTPKVSLSKDGVSVWHTVAELVLLAFCGPPTPGQQCCFLDSDRTNLDVDNLEWAAIEELEPGSARTRRTADDDDFICGLLAEGWSQKDVASYFNMSLMTVNQIFTKWRRAQVAAGNLKYSRDPEERAAALRQQIEELKERA